MTYSIGVRTFADIMGSEATSVNPKVSAEPSISPMMACQSEDQLRCPQSKGFKPKLVLIKTDFLMHTQGQSYYCRSSEAS